ncbi:MAG: hypothetical protein ACD_58C00103G0002 [uncultured bacterium]|nr:MAG: hypothetical protein ACD_58C00103G0002 [uncultured bacterium]
MDKLLVATKNPGKFAEFKILFNDLPVKLVSLQDLNVNHEVEEDGQTFEENAIKKAKEYSALSCLPTIADDGGLEIDALGGQPGVHSRRWFGHRMSDQELIDAVMDKMKDVPLDKRIARMRTVLALAIPNQLIKTFDGKIKVIIAVEASKKVIKGYPFRSFMYLPKQKKYFVDVSFEEQSKFSHRGKAVEKLKKYITEKYL